MLCTHYTHDCFSRGSRLEPSSQISCLSHKTPNPRTSHFRTRDFSRLAQDLSHRVNRNLCVSQNSQSSHLAQQVARAFVVVSLSIEHYFTFHLFLLHSLPTFYSTVNQTFIDVICTWVFDMRRSNECRLEVFRLDRVGLDEFGS